MISVIYGLQECLSKTPIVWNLVEMQTLIEEVRVQPELPNNFPAMLRPLGDKSLDNLFQSKMSLPQTITLSLLKH